MNGGAAPARRLAPAFARVSAGARGRASSCAVTLGLGFALALALAAPAAHAAPLPTFAAVKSDWRSSETLVLDRHGVPLQSLRTDPGARRLAWVPLDRVSPALRQAVMVAEDRRFEDHDGIDWQALADAAVGRAGPDGRRGASTLTMQLAGLVDPSLARPAGGRSVVGKIEQAAAAWRLERQWTKDQILEAWLNLVSFRGELVGVDAMSQGLFQKQPSGLDATESAVAAALVRAPNAPPAQVGARACRLLQAMGRAPSCETVRGLAELWLSRAPQVTGDPDLQLAPHLARQLLARAGSSPGSPGTPGASGAAAAPASVRSTLDAATQRRARDALREQLATLRDRGVEDGAVIVLDNASGDVLAWVGSSGELSSASQVDAVLSRRQPGSTLKPFLYELAIEHRWLTAASLLQDTPERLQTGAGLYIPQDYDHVFKGPVSVRTALGSSLNVPAVRTLVMVGPDPFARRLDDLGLRLAHPGDHYGYSLALGSAEVDLLSLANAYRALARGGLFAAPRLRLADPVPASRRVMDAAASWVVADILADAGARVPTFGLDSLLSPRYRASVKTGTSKDMRDNWCLGFDARYTVGVWVGNAGGDPMRDVSGVSGAAPVWRAVMDALHAREPRGVASAVPAAPPGVLRQPVRFAGGLEATRDEWFLAGTELAEVRPASAGGLARRAILSPEDRAVVALDPDIPPASQRLRFEAAPGTAGAGARWRLDGRWVGDARRPQDWMPWPGPHALAVVDGQGQVVDEVRFEVRGAQARPSSGASPAPRPPMSRPGHTPSAERS